MVQEKILVCINYGYNGVNLMERGASIANQLDCPWYILIFDSLMGEAEDDKSIDMHLFQNFADRHGGKLIIEKGNAHNMTKAITKTAKQIEATQIIIGQHTENLWTALIGGSVIDVLLNNVPEADLHVVPKARSEDTEEGEFEQGIQGYLIRQSDGKLTLSFQPEGTVLTDGRFYKQLNTDFNSGLFMLENENEIYAVHIVDGIADGELSKLVDSEDE
jgi:two-component system sensor histidine kinase KdpD